MFVCIGSWCLACVVRDLSCAVFLFMKSVSLYIWLGCTRERCQIFDLFRAAMVSSIRLYNTDTPQKSTSRAIVALHSRPRPLNTEVRLAPARRVSRVEREPLTLSLSAPTAFYPSIVYCSSTTHLVSHAERSRWEVLREPAAALGPSWPVAVCSDLCSRARWTLLGVSSGRAGARHANRASITRRTDGKETRAPRAKTAARRGVSLTVVSAHRTA